MSPIVCPHVCHCFMLTCIKFCSPVYICEHCIYIYHALYFSTVCFYYKPLICYLNMLIKTCFHLKFIAGRTWAGATIYSESEGNVRLPAWINEGTTGTEGRHNGKWWQAQRELVAGATRAGGRHNGSWCQVKRQLMESKTRAGGRLKMRADGRQIGRWWQAQWEMVASTTGDGGKHNKRWWHGDGLISNLPKYKENF